MGRRKNQCERNQRIKRMNWTVKQPKEIQSEKKQGMNQTARFNLKKPKQIQYNNSILHMHVYVYPEIFNCFS